ncbi:hypothetical protein, partial [Chamaesiphon sp. OTE_20_metabat_361]|uniref:hypothetical protein n=1 Tax=Chamaesiphon sp. OTE_20_metabat_361 TaxID=2964689 RepID=UPI00286C0ED3
LSAIWVAPKFGSDSRTPLFPDGLAAFLCLGFPPNKKTTRQRISDALNTEVPTTSSASRQDRGEPEPEAMAG